MLYMMVVDFLELPTAKSLRVKGNDSELMESLAHGYYRDNPITITDGKVSFGFRRRAALAKLLEQGRIPTDYLVSVNVMVSVMRPVAVNALGKGE